MSTAPDANVANKSKEEDKEKEDKKEKEKDKSAEKVSKSEDAKLAKKDGKNSKIEKPGEGVCCGTTIVKEEFYVMKPDGKGGQVKEKISKSEYARLDEKKDGKNSKMEKPKETIGCGTTIVKEEFYVMKPDGKGGQVKEKISKSEYVRLGEKNGKNSKMDKPKGADGGTVVVKEEFFVTKREGKAAGSGTAREEHAFICCTIL